MILNSKVYCLLMILHWDILGDHKISFQSIVKFRSTLFSLIFCVKLSVEQDYQCSKA